MTAEYGLSTELIGIIVLNILPNAFNDRAVFSVIKGEGFAVLAVSEHAFFLDFPFHCF